MAEPRTWNEIIIVNGRNLFISGTVWDEVEVGKWLSLGLG